MLTPEMTSPEGIIQVYFSSPTRKRIDPATCINALRAFKHHARYTSPRLSPTKAHVHEQLQSGSYLRGTRYYPSPDVFLYFFAHLVQDSAAGRLMLRGHVVERFGCEADALSLAMRLEACRLVGVDPPEGERERLLTMQRSDGAFGPA
ncbi:hypothetical protein CP533_6662, partial [Ophiocordyceps camponoti-saundersi (nom. inval.)]